MKISDLFDIKYGVNLELNKCHIVKDGSGVNFVARTANNNGVVAKVLPLHGLEPQPAGLITVAAGGSVLSSFVQSEPFYSGRDLYVLAPRNTMSHNVKLFYALCISRNAYRYTYGRQANKTIKDLELPDSIPDWVHYVSVTPISTKISKSEIKLKTSSWRNYRLSDIFDVERGSRITKENRLPGKYPLVTAGYHNEGIAEYIYTESNKLYRNHITIDMFGNAFYRDYEFYCDDNILVLKSRKALNKFVALFIVTVINADRYRYSYGRQFRKSDFLSSIIKLPESDPDTPDWSYMEDFVKSVPFSDKI